MLDGCPVSHVRDLQPWFSSLSFSIRLPEVLSPAMEAFSFDDTFRAELISGPFQGTQNKLSTQSPSQDRKGYTFPLLN